VPCDFKQSVYKFKNDSHGFTGLTESKELVFGTGIVSCESPLILLKIEVIAAFAIPKPTPVATPCLILLPRVLVVFWEVEGEDKFGLGVVVGVDGLS
jgi:hypothetical protein